MKPKRKRVTMVGMLDEAQNMLRELLVEGPRDWLLQARERMRDLPKTNFDLGCRFARQGKWLDAIFRFRVAAYFQPEYPQVWYNLGCCYFRSGRLPQAQVALQKALQQNPDQPETLFMLAAINPGMLTPAQRPDRMPASMVDEFFDSLAATYDLDEARNQYQAGKVVHELVAPLLKTQSPVVLDLACGTGIAARPWRLAAKEIIGVDSTASMVALADKATHAEKKLFDRVIAADAAQIPEDIAAESVDLVQLVNAAQFIGDVSEVMQSAARVLQPSGIFVVTVEPHSAATGFGVSAQTGRFGHAPAYVAQVAEAAGLKRVKDAAVQLYPGIAVQAWVFSKGGA